MSGAAEVGQWSGRGSLGSWLSGSCTCCTSMRTWVQILSVMVTYMLGGCGTPTVTPELGRWKTDREKAVFNWGPCFSDKVESDGRNITSSSDLHVHTHSQTCLCTHACIPIYTQNKQDKECVVDVVHESTVMSAF